ncbi:MAG: hypothetical protein R3351_00875 [Nitrospirales bacterium]|nr:hypothetical protein [Nitrospirales bacterium]
MNISFYPPKTIEFLLLIVLFPIIILVVAFSPANAKSYFEDGYLGLTQNEIRKKLGTPMAVRSRKAALRVFSYYTFKDWEKYFSKLVSPEKGEDVYTFTRNGIQVRYSFVYIPDLNEGRDFPTLYVRRIEIEFTPAVPLEEIPNLVPEFVPPTEPNSPAFRSNLWVLIFKGLPSHEARMIVKERGKEKLPWSLAYQMFALNGIPDLLTLQTPFDRMEISTQSLQVVKTRQRLTHEPIMNPFSKEFAELPPPPKAKPRHIPVPKYAD